MCIFSRSAYSFSTRELLASAQWIQCRGPQRWCWDNSCSWASAFSFWMEAASSVWVLEEGYHSVTESQAFSTVYAFLSSPPLPSTLGMPTSQWSAFPEMAITIKSISWKPKCFPNCLKSHRREDVTTDWKRRRKQSQVHDAFPFYKQSQMRPMFSKLSDLLF